MALRCADTRAQPVERALSGPENRKERQREQNTGARRALNVVKQKLQGWLGRIARLWLMYVQTGVEHKDRLSVEGQVQSLINKATSVVSLCQMYEGWGAWL
jgi:hypothetical protein